MNAAHRSGLEVAILHTLRVKGFAEPAAISAVTGFPLDEVLRQLAVDQARGLVRHRQGRAPGWSLTDLGRKAHGDRLADEWTQLHRPDLVAEAFDRFLRLNGPFKELCADWQMGGDEAAACIDRLMRIHDAIRPIVLDLASVLSRTAHYAGRLQAALDQVVCGQWDAFTRPLVDSYHDVWMELHEDLLLTLGRQRSDAEHT